MTQTHDLRIMNTQRITTPAQLRREIPLSDAGQRCVVKARQAIAQSLAGTDDKMVVIVGPCSIHDVDAAREYAAWLHAEAQRHHDTLIIIMRTYFEKPRTTVGWKGLINDPHLNGSHDMESGIRLARQLLVDVTDMGLACATEVLDPVTPQYLADTLSWTAIGARTTESQTHREMASGLSMPVGFKNGTDGSLTVALNAMESAASPHAFRGIDDGGHVSIISTAGNPDGHVVLRGSSSGPNYSAGDITTASAAAKARHLPHRVLIDCSHGNSAKDHTKQNQVCAAVSAQIAAGSDNIMGLMIESNLVAGRQNVNRNIRDMTRGQSITDACIDTAHTAQALEQLAQAVTQRRQGS